MTDTDLADPPELYNGPFAERLTRGQRLRRVLQRLGLRGVARVVRRAVR
ncbi:MAG TPA: hypothetical protein VNR59_06770 [Gaiellaceae bacterium]|nr:hypothetical protein [Gaiellaceae bacterium]